MDKKWWLIGLLVVSGLGLLFWSNSDTQVIKRRANAILDTFHFEEDEKSPLVSEKLQDLMDETIVLKTPEGKMHAHWKMRDGSRMKRGNAVAAHRTIQQYAESGTVTNREIEILSIENQIATVSVKFHLDVKVKKGSFGKKVDDDFDCIFTFEQKKGDWLLTGVEIK